MKTIDDLDLTGAEFRETDLSGARFIGVVMQDVEIDGLIGNLVINGVEVSEFVAAELDRRHPVRVLIRSNAPSELQEAHRQLQADWESTVRRLRAMPAGSEHRSVNQEWSAIQTLRHLVFVHYSWFRRCCLGSTARFTPLGLAPDFVEDQERQGLGPAADPTLDEVLAVRAEQGSELADWLRTVTESQLAGIAPVPEGPGWPPYAAGKTVRECLGVVLNEEWAHHQFCVRDLDLITS
ncbi:DinB family protein [Propionibacteriaceae bacterium Y1685]|uniref:DinB family protein n=1 Tax=Microlunatus sp. Y1700 TaxID=3418487 RepID=UPI003B7DD619